MFSSRNFLFSNSLSRNDNPTIKSAVPVPQLTRLLLLACWKWAGSGLQPNEEFHLSSIFIEPKPLNPPGFLHFVFLLCPLLFNFFRKFICEYNASSKFFGHKTISCKHCCKNIIQQFSKQLSLEGRRGGRGALLYVHLCQKILISLSSGVVNFSSYDI